MYFILHSKFEKEKKSVQWFCATHYNEKKLASVTYTHS